MKCADEKKAQAVFAKALARIKPSDAETRSDFEAANHLIKKLESVVPSNIEVELAGSLAKGTNLKDKNEFDIFILFPTAYSHKEMVMLGLHYARQAFREMRVESRYAEHPYLQVFHGDYHADIVPAYKIGHISERGSSVDRSQLHTAYVNSKLDAKGKDDVRLLKAFMGNFGIYGAELRVEGFSGYLCELLVMQYGSLQGLFEAASEWNGPALDIEKHSTSGNLREAFPSPLVVIDPVDPKRNVAAVVAQTSLSRFIFECRRFLAAPSEKFFFSQKCVRSLPEIKRMMRLRGTACLAVAFPAPKVVPDVLWPQLKKTAQALVRHMQSLGFSVFGYYHWSDGAECAVLFELECEKLPCVRKAVGPSIKFASDVDAFVKAHAGSLNLHLEHDRIVAVEKREVVDALSALRMACKNPHDLGIPENMAHALKAAKVSGAGHLLKQKYAEFLSDYFFAKIA
jgi:tRNA nucleotidyltransferase (CCA-adding enzyme)